MTTKPPADPDATDAPGPSFDGAATDDGLPPVTEALTPGTTVAGYVVDGKLGEGGMSVVYAATHPLIHKRAAIKVLGKHDSVAAIERFLQEARAVNQIGHPNIVDIFQFGVLPDGRHYLVMELLAGETLGALLTRRRPALDEALAILDPVCRALEAAHAKGIVHRDLKPDNVFLVEVRDEPPRVKLLDFGIAKLLHDDTRLERTEIGDVIGTPRYLSPEQARAVDEIDHRADVYSLGVMAFYMVCGRLPFVDEDPEVLLGRHINDPPPAPASVWPDVPADLADLLVRMMAKRRDDRPSLVQARTLFARLRAA
jgi:eukaryotic-like serine/threonine-protein kinase